MTLVGVVPSESAFEIDVLFLGTVTLADDFRFQAVHRNRLRIAGDEDRHVYVVGRYIVRVLVDRLLDRLRSNPLDAADHTPSLVLEPDTIVNQDSLRLRFGVIYELLQQNRNQNVSHDDTGDEKVRDEVDGRNDCIRACVDDVTSDA